MDQYRRIKVLSHLKNNKKKKNTSLHEPYLFLDKCSSGIMSVCHLDCWNVMPAPSTVWKDFGSWMQADHKMNVEIFCPQKAQAHYVYFPFKQWPYMRTDMNRTQSPDTWQLGWEGSCTVTTKKKKCICGPSVHKCSDFSTISSDGWGKSILKRFDLLDQ